MIITEHWVDYNYKGVPRRMRVRKLKSEYETLFSLRLKKGDFIIQFYDYRWNNLTPSTKVDYILVQLIGEAISSAKLLYNEGR